MNNPGLSEGNMNEKLDRAGEGKTDAADSAASKNYEALREFMKFCHEHPEYRFWQALREWIGYSYILVSNGKSGDEVDTFYWDGLGERAAPSTPPSLPPAEQSRPKVSDAELISRQAQALEVAERALTFYADPDTYDQVELLGSCGLSDDINGESGEFGIRARAALAEIKRLRNEQ